jgi:hypothetical protein
MNELTERPGYITECFICPARRDWIFAQRVKRDQAARIKQATGFNRDFNEFMDLNHKHKELLRDKIQELKNEREDLWCDIEDRRIDNTALQEANEKYRLKQIGLTAAVVVLAALLGAVCMFIATGGVS